MSPGVSRTLAGRGSASSTASPSSTDSRISAGWLSGRSTCGPGRGGLGGDGGGLGRIGRRHDDDPIGPALPQRRHDAMDERLAFEFHQQLRPAHADAPSGGGHHGGDHDFLAAMGGSLGLIGLVSRSDAPRGPRLRLAISSATMLIAISITL